MSPTEQPDYSRSPAIRLCVTAARGPSCSCVRLAMVASGARPFVGGQNKRPRERGLSLSASDVSACDAILSRDSLRQSSFLAAVTSAVS